MGASADAEPILLSVNGAEYRLAFSMGALRRLEQRAGKTFGEVAADLDRQSFSAMLELLRAALEREHGRLDDDDVDRIVDGVGFSQAANALGRAIARDFRADENPQTPSVDEAGTTS